MNIDPNKVAKLEIETKEDPFFKWDGDGHMKVIGYITNYTCNMTGIATIQFEMMVLAIEKSDGTKLPIGKLPIGRILSNE